MIRIFGEGISRRDFLKGAASVGVVATITGLAGCSKPKKGTGSASGSGADKAGYKIEMVTDTGGVNDQAFNQLSWKGLQQLGKDEGWHVSYLESKQESDYATNFDKAIDDGNDLIWGIGFAMAEQIGDAAAKNPDVKYAIIDNANPTSGSNLTGVQFRGQEPSFMVGYIAGCTSKTGKVGFVGGVGSDVIDQFEFGYKGGVAYANKQKGTSVEVQAQYAESFTDQTKGKAITSSMFSNGCDIVFHAAGGVGIGVIQAAEDAGKFAIGVDMDQSHVAPKNVLTSALKKVDVAVIDISKKLLSGELKGGSNMSFGIAEDSAGIPEEHGLMDDAVYDEAIDIGEKIKSGDIVPPSSSDEYEKYTKSLS